MAKKNRGTFSYIEAREALEALATTATKESFAYDLLRIFCGYGDATIARVQDGRGNDAKDGKTILIKKLLAYRPTEYTLLGEEDVSDVIEMMEKDPAITKKEPRLYITFDGKTIYAHDPKENDVYYNDIDLLWKDFDFFKPLAGIEKFRNYEETEADVKSAEMMAKIFDDISRYNDIRDAEQIHRINVFMTRLLFCYFAEDTGLFPVHNMFSNAIREDTKVDGSDLQAFMEGIFDVMTINDATVRATLPTHFAQFPYVNGGLFKEHVPVPTLSRQTRILMLKCGEYDWKEINPDIFGSMIQAVVNPEVRAGLGVHYTSVPNIMKVIKPLFLDELTEEYVRVQNDEKRLRHLLARLGKIKFFDPACGSGNFLIIAYKCIRELEIEIWERIQTLQGGQLGMPFSNISLQQFYGIEIDEYACDTATLSLWLAEHQMNNMFYERLGTRPDALPLRPSGHIVCGNACRLDWNTVCPHTADEEVYVMGNPPYVGSSKLDKEQQEDRTIAIGEYQNYKKIDYIGIWLIKGARYIKDTKARYAFVSTNSVCQGEMVEPLWSPILGLDIELYCAYTTFKWANNAKYNAGVSCVILVFTDAHNPTTKYIITENIKRRVNGITPYLTEGGNLIVSKHTKPVSLLPTIRMGCKPVDGGNLILSPDEMSELVSTYPETEKWIKKLYSASDFIDKGEKYCLWISDNDRESAQMNPIINARFERTAAMRLSSPDKSAREMASRPHQFREFIACDSNTFIIPAHTSENRKYIPMGYADSDTIITNAMYMVCDAPKWVFAVVSSYMSMIWARNIGGRLESRLRYTNLCYNSFPLPKINEEQKARLTALAEHVLFTRENHTEMTLGEMYNPESMPLDLKLAHQAMDIAVEQCYRPEPFTSDEERLEYLFKLYEKMTKKK